MLRGVASQVNLKWVCSKSVEKKRRLSLSKPGRPAYAFDRLRLQLPEFSIRFVREAGAMRQHIHLTFGQKRVYADHCFRYC